MSFDVESTRAIRQRPAGLMKAFLLSDDEIWAAESVQDAIVCARVLTGENYPLVKPCELTDEELDTITALCDARGRFIRTTPLTLRELLHTVTGPCFLAAAMPTVPKRARQAEAAG